jgi:hypothetical protein
MNKPIFIAMVCSVLLGIAACTTQPEVQESASALSTDTATVANTGSGVEPVAEESSPQSTGEDEKCGRPRYVRCCCGYEWQCVPRETCVHVCDKQAQHCPGL